MFFLLLAVTIFAVYATCVHIGKTADRDAQSRIRRGPAAPVTTSILPGDDLIEVNVERLTWTALDDHQLDRLLKGAMPTNDPDRPY